MTIKRNEPTPPPAAADLLERPLTARSVIASLLLGRHPPAAPVALLVRWCALFGISETSARVTLSRMVERGELSAAEATYELAGRVRGRQADQDFAFAPELEPWDGRWSMAVVREGRRDPTARAALRAALARSRMAPVREGVWVRPHNLADGVATAADRRTIAAQCSWWVGAPSSALDVEALFSMRSWAARGRTLLERLVLETSRLPAESALADAFVVGAAAAQHLRRDPLLPAELLPRRWPGDELRARYAAYVRAMDRAVRAWTRAAL